MNYLLQKRKNISQKQKGRIMEEKMIKARLNEIISYKGIFVFLNSASQDGIVASRQETAVINSIYRPCELWLYRGSDQRKEVETLIARNGMDINYEFEADVAPMAVIDIPTVDKSIEEPTGPESFARIAKNEEAVCILYQERKRKGSVEKTYVAIDEKYQPVGILRIMYPLSDEIFYKLNKGILFSNLRIENPSFLLDKITQNLKEENL